MTEAEMDIQRARVKKFNELSAECRQLELAVAGVAISTDAHNGVTPTYADEVSVRFKDQNGHQSAGFSAMYVRLPTTDVKDALLGLLNNRLARIRDELEKL